MIKLMQAIWPYIMAGHMGNTDTTFWVKLDKLGKNDTYSKTHIQIINCLLGNALHTKEQNMLITAHYCSECLQNSTANKL